MIELSSSWLVLDGRVHQETWRGLRPLRKHRVAGAVWFRVEVERRAR